MPCSDLPCQFYLFIFYFMNKDKWWLSSNPREKKIWSGGDIGYQYAPQHIMKKVQNATPPFSKRGVQRRHLSRLILRYHATHNVYIRCEMREVRRRKCCQLACPRHSRVVFSRVVEIQKWKLCWIQRHISEYISSWNFCRRTSINNANFIVQTLMHKL
jgi:hypothetical protein